MEPRYSSEKAHMVVLCSLPWVPRKWLKAMLHLFGSPVGAWEALASGQASQLITVQDEWKEFVNEWEPLSFMASLEDRGIKTVVLHEEGYPEKLTLTDRAPYTLFYKGELPGDEPAVAVVGCRKATPYGIEVSKSIGSGLAEAGLTVVSGAAYGIDSYAHIGALEAGGRTVAVLGCGPDIAYPASNAKLLKRIADSGCVMSEYPPGTHPNRLTFPERNRIIAGLSLGVVVVEASMKSGALITSDYAAEYSREVMAVPGPVLGSNSAGANDLIRSGAALVTGRDDILAELGLPRPGTRVTSEVSLDDSVRQLLVALATGTREIDELSRAASLSSGDTLVALCSLEMEGLARRGPGGCYQPTAAGCQVARK
jgi:DNA processing protein